MSSDPDTSMADEMAPSEGSPVSSAATADNHKRKLDDFELNKEPEPSPESEPNLNADALSTRTMEEDNGGADESDSKRPRMESNCDNVIEADGLVRQNGGQEEDNKDEHDDVEKKDESEEEEKKDLPKEEESEQPESADTFIQHVEDQEPPKEPLETISQAPPKEPLETISQAPPEQLLETTDQAPPKESLVTITQAHPKEPRETINLESPKEPLKTITQEPPKEPLEINTQEPRKETLETITQEPPKEPIEIITQAPPEEPLETINQAPAPNDNDKAEMGSSDELGQQNVPIEECFEIPREGDVPVHTAETQLGSGVQILSRKMEIPNDKVGVLIGKAGDTIRSLQDNSGAKIQIMRDADADPRSTTRPVELVGTLEDINKAEKLIKDVIAEADAGGSPSLVARGFNTAQATSGGEQVEIQVPIEKVGLIIGKGGETIRNLQTRSGARIQLLQQNLSDGEQSKERTVRITGNKKQIETSREMIKDVMNQIQRPPPPSSGYSQQQDHRPRGPVPSQWGPPRGPHNSYPGYDYPQRGPYPSQNSQYPPPYGNYPPYQAPRSNSGPPSWEQRPSASMHGPSPLGNYNNGQHPGPEYGQRPPSYSQTPAQPYSHGYNEAKYDNHQHFGPQPTPYTQHSYGPPQDHYSKPPMYNIPPQVPHTQPYSQPRPNQPGEGLYQGSGPSAQSYGQNMPPQQSYPYASSVPIQQSYPNTQYGSVPTSDGYGYPPVAAPSGAGYGQPVAGYGQTGAQQQPPPAYPQTVATGGYGSYPTSHPTGYAEPPAANNATYGYNQVASEPSSYGAPQGPAATYPATGVGQSGYAQATAPQGPAATYPATGVGQSGYAQATQAQPGYDQSSGYGNASAPVGYGKSVSPQTGYAPPQYDASQMYGGHR